MLTGTKLERLEYFPETGDWIWRDPPGHNSQLRDKPAGNRRADGYLLIRIEGTAYYASRLAFVWMLGRWPFEEVDHVDRDPSNDRWDNLRDATSSENKYNREPNGMRGVYRSGENSWWVMVGRNNYLGTFDSLEKAIAARDAEALRLGGDFAILNS